MKKTLGLIETSSISKGMEILDTILKRTKIGLITDKPICPGKYLIIIEGTVQAIDFALEVSRAIGEKITRHGYKTWGRFTCLIVYISREICINII